MTPAQKQSAVNLAAQGTGNLARLLHYPDAAFLTEFDKLIHTLLILRGEANGPHLSDGFDDEDL
jgi:hypothetical protein